MLVIKLCACTWGCYCIIWSTTYTGDSDSDSDSDSLFNTNMYILAT